VEKNVFLFVVLLCISFIIASCEDTNKPELPIDLNNDNYFLFIEHETVTSVEFKEGSEHYFPNDIGQMIQYSFDKDKRSLRVDTELFSHYENFRIDTAKFILGRNFFLESNLDKPKRAYLNSERYMDGNSGYGNHIFSEFASALSPHYRFKKIDCSSQGEIQIGFRSSPFDYNYKEFTLQPNEVFYDSIVYKDYVTNIGGTTYSYNFIKDVTTIKNHGFIKKSDVSYY
jgi:hypothetical protein